MTLPAGTAPCRGALSAWASSRLNNWVLFYYYYLFILNPLFYAGRGRAGRVSHLAFCHLAQLRTCLAPGSGMGPGQRICSPNTGPIPWGQPRFHHGCSTGCLSHPWACHIPGSKQLHKCW